MKERLGGGHNNWPKNSEVVKINKIDQENPREMYHLGFLRGSAQLERSIWIREIPSIVLQELRANQPFHQYGTTRVMFTWAPSRGQFDDLSKRNFLAVFGTGYVELGCAHKYLTTKLGNCYYRGVCERCGHRYEVDSGD